MNLFRKINRKLILISIIFMTVFISATSLLIDDMLDSVIELTADVHYNQLSRQLEKEFAILESITEKIATNENVIDLLDQNRSFDQLSTEENALMMDQINIFENVLDSARFVETVNIVSLSGDYLFSKGSLYESFFLTERPWYKEEYLTEYTSSIVTDIHRDFNTGRDTIGIVSFIYTKDQKELLGAVILDIFLDQLLGYANSTFYSGELETIILPMDEDSASLVNQYQNKKYYIRELDTLLKDSKLIFCFDKESIKQTSLIGTHINEVKKVTVLVGILIAIALIVSIRVAFRPALKSIEK